MLILANCLSLCGNPSEVDARVVISDGNSKSGFDWIYSDNILVHNVNDDNPDENPEWTIGISKSG